MPPAPPSFSQEVHDGIEYVWVSPNHTWAGIGSPPFDPGADVADFASKAGDHVTSLDIRTWVTWADVSLPPAPDAVVSIWEVVEWDVRATSEGLEALRAAFGKVKAALEQQGGPLTYTVNEAAGVDAGPQMFVAIAHESLGELDANEPGMLEGLLAETYGHADAVQIMRTFEAYLTPTARRIWTLRPDLSYMPGM